MTAIAKPEQFHGTWMLLTMRAHVGNGCVREPCGKSPLGFITYTPDGRMHAILMHPERPPIGTPVEEFGRRRGLRQALFALSRFRALVRIAMGTLQSAAYSARWEIRGDEIVHHVDASVLPDWIGTDLVRTYAFVGDTLTLTAKYPTGQSIVLVWQKT